MCLDTAGNHAIVEGNMPFLLLKRSRENIQPDCIPLLLVLGKERETDNGQNLCFSKIFECTKRCRLVSANSAGGNERSTIKVDFPKLFEVLRHWVGLLGDRKWNNETFARLVSDFWSTADQLGQMNLISTTVGS